MFENHLAHIAQLEAKFGAESDEVATALNTLAFLICQSGDPADALPYFDRSITIREALHGPESLLPQLNQWIEQSGPVQFRHLEPFLLGRLEIMTTAWGEIDPRIAEECDRIASRYLYRHEPKQARPFLEQSLAIVTELHGADSEEVGKALERLVEACLRAGDQKLAARHRDRRIAVAERAHGADSAEVAATLVSLALAAITASKQAPRELVQQAIRREAEELCDRALSIEQAVFGPDSLQVQQTLEAVSRALLDCRDFHKAERLLRRLLDICERAHGNDAAALLWILANLAQIYAYDRSQLAEPTLERCFAILRRFLDVRRPTMTTRITDLKDGEMLYSSNSSGLLEMLVRISERVDYNSRKRWGG